MLGRRWGGGLICHVAATGEADASFELDSGLLRGKCWHLEDTWTSPKSGGWSIMLLLCTQGRAQGSGAWATFCDLFWPAFANQIMAGSGAQAAFVSPPTFVKMVLQYNESKDLRPIRTTTVARGSSHGRGAFGYKVRTMWALIMCVPLFDWALNLRNGKWQGFIIKNGHQKCYKWAHQAAEVVAYCFSHTGRHVWLWGQMWVLTHHYSWLGTRASYSWVA